MSSTLNTQLVNELVSDMTSFANFMYKPAGFKVTRRLAPSIDTLQYYVDRLSLTVDQTLGLYAADIYKDVATGLAATEDTNNFWVVPNAVDDLANLTLYNNAASVAVKLYELYNLESYMIEEYANWETGDL